MYPVVLNRAPIGLAAKLGKLDEILIRGRDSSLNPTLSTQPDNPVKRREVSNQMKKLRARTAGDKTYTNYPIYMLNQ